MRVLTDAAKAGTTDELVAIFGPEGKELITSADPAMWNDNTIDQTLDIAPPQ